MPAGLLARCGRRRRASGRQPVAALGLLELAALGELGQCRRDGLRARDRFCRPPGRRSWPRRRRAWRAPRPSSRRERSGGESEPPPGLVARSASSSALEPSACASLHEQACAREACAPAALRARVERGECLTQPVGLGGELVNAVLDLFTKAVDHVVSFHRGRGERSYTPRPDDHRRAAGRSIECCLLGGLLCLGAALEWR